MYGERKGGFRPRGGMGMSPPVKVGEELEVTIEAVGEKGDGLAKKNGFVLFVPNVKEGQHVKVRVTKVLRKVGFAEVIGEGSAPAAKAPAEESSEDFGEAEESEETSEETQSESDDFGEAEESEETSEDFGEEQTESDEEKQ